MTLFVEVSHGPYVVDHNLFGSAASLKVVSGGGAYVNNLIAGTVRLEPVMDRATPYHLPHSTQVAGFSVIAGGDDRWIGNLFLGGNLDDAYLPGTSTTRRPGSACRRTTSSPARTRNTGRGWGRRAWTTGGSTE